MMAIVSVAGIAVLQSGLRFYTQNNVYILSTLDENRKSIQERLTIDDVWFYTAGNVKVSVINTGKVSAKIMKVSFNETDVTLSTQVILGLDESSVISVPYSWTGNRVYLVSVESERGKIYGGYWKSP